MKKVVSSLQQPVDAGAREIKASYVEISQKTSVNEIVKNIDEEGKVEPVVVKEIKKERTENSNTYLLNNGMKKTEYYSDNIRFKDENGQLTEYAPELVNIDKDSIKQIVKSAQVSKKDAAGYAYENKSGDTKQYLPKELGSDTPILLVNEDYRVSFAPVEEKTTDKTNGAENFFEQTEKVSRDTENITDAQGDDRQAEVKAEYTDEKNRITLSYQSLEHGIKESIILQKVPSTNVFSFSMVLENMVARLDAVGGGISFIDEEKDATVGGVDAPFMNDAGGEAYSEDIFYELEEVECAKENIHKYILHVVADEEYLKSENRQYPVTIDPSASWTGVNDLPETYILRATPETNYFASGVKTFSVGKGSQGLFRSLFKILYLNDTVDGKYVESAKLTVYENGSSTKGTVIEARTTKDIFKCSSVTWESKPIITAKVFDTITSSGTADAVKTFDITEYVRGVANGTYDNRGLILKAKDESADSTYVKFYGARTSVTSKRPKVSVIYYDGPTVPSAVSLNKSDIKANEKLQVSWSGITSKALDYVQYRVTTYDPATKKDTGEYISYSASTKVGTVSSGTKTITESTGWKEGYYRLHIRGVDKGGIKGTAKAVCFTIDRTAPDFESFTVSPVYQSGEYSKTQPTVEWKVIEKNIQYVQVSINNGAYTNIGTSNTGKVQLTGLVSGKSNSINLRAVDKAGNISSNINRTYNYDNALPIITLFKVDSNTSAVQYSRNKNPEIEYAVNDSTFKSAEITVGNTKPKKISLSEKSGKVCLENGMLQEGMNSIYIRATDRAGNVSDNERPVSGTSLITYYLDTDEPITGEISITPKTSSSSYRNVLPIITWSGFEDSFFQEMQVSINGGEYQTLGLASSGEAQLEASGFPKKGVYEIKVRAIDMAGNTSDVWSTEYYYKEAVSNADEYRPVNVYAVEKIGGNTLIRFSNEKGEFPGDIVYEVHRGTTPLFVPDNTTLIKTGGTDGAVQVTGNEGQTYYYKLRATTLDGAKAYSEFSDEISSITLSEDEVNERCGIKDIYEYQEFGTPNGNGNIELSRGNFIYEQSDLSLPAHQIPIDIRRIYNSKSRVVTEFGYGWSNTYDAHVSELSGTGRFVYQDGSKAVYVFTKEDEGYTCSENTDMKLQFLPKELSRIIKEYHGEQTKEVQIEIQSRYRITTKENETLYFDDCGRLVLMEEANDTFVYVKYDNGGHIDFIETSEGQKADYTYGSEEDNRDFISKISIADGSYFSYEYENGRLAKAVHHGTKGGTIEYHYTYDADGFLSVITDAEGNDYGIQYNDEKVTRVTYPEGEYYSLKENNFVITTKYTSDGKELYHLAYSFYSDGKIKSRTDVMGNTSTYDYNGDLLTGTIDKVSYYTIQDGVVTTVSAEKKDEIVYDENKNIISKTDKERNVTVYTYGNTEKNLKNFPTYMETRDAQGNVTSKEAYEYDDRGNIVRIIDYILNIVSVYTYDDNGNVTTTTETLVEAEDIEGDKAEEYGLISLEEVKEYNADGNVSNENYKEGTIQGNMKPEYDLVGRVIREITENADNQKNRIITKYHYDEFGRVDEIRAYKNDKELEADKAKVTKKQYNKNGTLIMEEDEVGRVTTFEYDEMNRPVKQILKAGSETRETRTQYEYKSVTVNEGSETGKEITNASVVRTSYKAQDGKYKVTGETYTNALGQVVRELSSGLYVDYTYDSQGRVFTTYTGGNPEENNVNIAEGKLTVSLHDENGNLTYTIINPEWKDGYYRIGKDSIVTSNVYDNTGMLVKTVNAKENETVYEYDNQGRLTKVKLNDGTGVANETLYTYDIENKDSDGNFVSTSETVKDALGRISETVLNEAGQTMSVIDRSSGNSLVTSYEYDTNGNTIKETYSDGSYTAYEYDEFNYNTLTYTVDKDRKVEKSTVYYYDDEYNLIKTVDSIGKGENAVPYRYTIYKYDIFGRNTGIAEISSSTEPTDELIEKAMITYVYDIEDNLIKIYYPNTAHDELKGIGFVYNKDKWITQIDGIVGDSEIENVIRTYEYYTDGKIKDIRDYSDFLNGGTSYIERDYQYDVHDRVVSMKYFNSKNVDKILEQYEYTYDKNSNILTEHTKLLYEDNLKDEERNYIYDELDRLVKTEITNHLTYETSEISYEFDKVGNRTRMTEDETVTDYIYNDLNQLVKSVATGKNGSYTTTYTYDLKGNQVKVTDEKKNIITENIYDVRNQLIGVKVTENGIVTKTQTNEYNGAGQRISKTDNGVKIYYFYEGSFPLYTTDESGNKTSQNIIGNQSNIIAGIRYGNGQHGFIYSKDIQGSTSVITDENCNYVVSYDYTDYGETTKQGNTDFYNEICYTGGVYDELTGLYYLNARYYDPKNGSFLSQDTYRGSSGDYAGFNLYAYCAGNPVKYVDPSGHWIDMVIDIVGCVADAYEFVKDPSVENAIYVSIDVACAVVPFLSCGGSSKLTINAGKKVVAKVSKRIKKGVNNITKKICAKYGGKSALKQVGKNALKKASAGKRKLKIGAQKLKYKIDTAKVSLTDEAGYIKYVGKSDLQKTAAEIIAERKKSKINREFPGEWRHCTLEEIETAAKQGNKSAQSAKKLLKDKRFDKKDNRK